MGKNARILHDDTPSTLTDDAPPVAEKPMKNKVYRRKLKPLHGELVALQEWSNRLEPRSASYSKVEIPRGRAVSSKPSPSE